MFEEIYMYIHIHMYIHIYIYTYMHTYMCTYVYAYIHMYIHIHIYIHIYMHAYHIHNIYVCVVFIFLKEGWFRANGLPALCELRGDGFSPWVSTSAHADCPLWLVCVHMSFLRELPAEPPKVKMFCRACTTAVEYPRADGEFEQMIGAHPIIWSAEVPAE